MRPLSSLFQSAGGSATGRTASLLLVLILGVSLVKFSGLITNFLLPALPELRLWPNPDEQYRRALSPVPYDLLRAADATLPRQASVLLVTPGNDIRNSEYSAYHRALFFLTPRPVWWLSAAKKDGTWETREWISASLTPQSVETIAGERGADYLIAYALPTQLNIGQELFSNGEGQLIQLDLSAAPLEPQAPPSSAAGRFWPLQVMAAVITVMGLGCLILSGIARLGFKPGGVEFLALAWALGAGFLSLAMFWLSGLGVELKGQLILLTLAGLPGLYLGGRRLASKKPDEMAARRPALFNSPLKMLLLVILAGQIAFVGLLAVGRPLSAWDSWATWGVKARTIFLEGSLSPALYADPSRASTLPQYPLMFPAVEAWLFGWLGAADDRLAGVVSLLFYAALAGVVHAAVLRRTSRAGLALLASTAAVCLPFTALLAGLVYADVPFALLATLVLVYALEWLEGGSPGCLAVSALAAGLAAWTKQEGVILLGAAAGAVVVCECMRERRIYPSRRGLLWTGACLVSTLVLAGPWGTLVQQKGIVERIFLPVTPQTLLDNLDRLPRIAELAEKILAGSDFAFLWPLALIFAVFILGKSGWRSALQDRRNILFLFALGYLILAGSSYMFSAYAHFQDHITSSYYRLAMQVSPIAVIWLALF